MCNFVIIFKKRNTQKHCVQFHVCLEGFDCFGCLFVCLFVCFFLEEGVCLLVLGVFGLFLILYGTRMMEKRQYTCLLNTNKHLKVYKK